MKKRVTFPADLLHVDGGTLFRTSHGWTLELPLRAFDLPCGFEGSLAEEYRQINTQVRADFAVDLAKLGHRPVRFKPQSDKIEASVYLICAHHPIDFTTIDTSDFPREGDQSGTLRLEGRIDFGFEGLEFSQNAEYSPAPIEFRLRLGREGLGFRIEPDEKSGDAGS
jgi:hypothetical protein